jgi:hypothetical protein
MTIEDLNRRPKLYRFRRTVKRAVKSKRRAQKTARSFKRSSTVPMDISPIPSPTPSQVMMEIEEYKQAPLALDLSFKGLTISLVIMGHGAVDNTRPLVPFRPPKHHPMGKINILGLRFSGLLNLTTTQYDEDIDQYLAKYKNSQHEEFISILNRTFEKALEGGVHTENENIRRIVIEFFKRVETLRKQYPQLGDNFFGTKNNYGKRNAQKYFTGITETEYKDKHRHGELTTTGPLVKIYSILRGKEELLKENVTIKMTETYNNMSMTELIDMVIDYVLNNPQILTAYERPLYADKLPINIEVVDLTCNHTDDYPIIGFIE